MANLTETLEFTSGIYQLETTDQPVGGPAGIANRQAIQIANRTAWLKQERDRGRYCGGLVSTNATIFDVTATHAGKILRSFTAPGAPSGGPNFRLPAIADFPSGNSIIFFNSNDAADALSRSITITANGSELILAGYTGATTYSIPPGYACEICKPDGSTSWLVTSRIAFDGEADGAGEIIASGRSVRPRGYLSCNGAAVSRITYNTLFSAIGTAFGVGDGSTTFNVPDLRGEFLRGLDGGRGIDPGRFLGQFQSDELKSHSHNLSPLMGTNYIPTAGIQTYMLNSAGGSFGGNVSNTGGTETRPRNVAVNYFIKY